MKAVRATSIEGAPTGCPGCNPSNVLPALQARGIHVEEVPATQSWSDVFVCDRCGRGWLLMPRQEDPKKPVA